MLNRPASTAGILIAGLVFLTLLTRVLGPVDLNGTDQHRTMSYTLDMLLRGGEAFVLPQDSWGFGATKPPLYNWIGLPFLWLLGPLELVYKLPALLSTLIATAAVAVAGWRLGDRSRQRVVLAVLAVAAFLLNTTIIKLVYYARPDMPLVACVAVAWLAATLGLARADEGEPAGRHAVVFWLAVALGLLAKGPPALLVVAYAFLAARVCFGKWSLVRSLWPGIGLPLALAPFAAWLVGAFAIDASHAGGVLVGEEVGRVSDGAWLILEDIYKVPLNFVEKFFPWSICVIVAAVLASQGVGLWRSKAGPGVLLVLVFVAALSLSAGKRSVYLAPTYAVAAPLAALGLLLLWNVLGRWRSVLIAVPLIGLGMTLWYVFVDSYPASTGRGDRLKAFAAAVDSTAGNDGIVFGDAGNNPLQSLLGRHQASRPALRPVWVVTRVTPDNVDDAVKRSGQLWEGLDGNETRGVFELGLFHVEQQGDGTEVPLPATTN